MSLRRIARLLLLVLYERYGSLSMVHLIVGSKSLLLRLILDRLDSELSRCAMMR